MPVFGWIVFRCAISAGKADIKSAFGYMKHFRTQAPCFMSFLWALVACVHNVM